MSIFNSKKRIFSALLLFSIVLSVCISSPRLSAEESVEGEQNQDAFLSGDGFQKVLENESLELKIDKSTCKIQVIEKDRGTIWYSNPPGLDCNTDPQLNSQIMLTYCNSSANEFTADSYSESILKKEFEINCEKDKITVTYSMGEEDMLYVFPRVISVKRMEKFLENVSKEHSDYVLRFYGLKSLSRCKTDEDAKDLKQSYKSISADNDLYVVRGLERNKSQKAKVTEILRNAGYTAEDLAKDNEDNFVDEDSEKDKYFFSVPVVYELDGDGFVAYIDGENLQYNNKFPLKTISLLPFFGAAVERDTGYIFVPDGSGALIDFNSRDVGVSTYKGEVYGHDNTFIETNKTADVCSISLPVYGLHYENKGLFAVIEDGESFASVNAGINTSLQYNYAYTEFNILPNTQVMLGDNLGTNKLLTYQKEHYKGKFKVRYTFLGESSTYSDMALYYRSYLEKRGLLKKNDCSDAQFIMNVLGSIDKTKSFLGIPYNGNVTLTTFEQCQKMAQSLKDDGIKNPDVLFSGWLGGLRQSAPTSVRPLKSLGGKKGLKKLISGLAKENISFYPAVNFQYVWKNNLFDGFSVKNDAAVSLTRNSALLSGYDIVDGSIDSDRPYAYIVSPLRYSELSKSFAKSYGKYDNKYIYIDTLSSELNSDHNKSDPQNRQNSLNLVTKVLDQISEKYTVCSNGFNAYALKYINKAVNVPQISNDYMVFSESVPFLQMIIHGYITYTGTPLNYSSVMTEDFLKAIETGSGIYVDWIYSDNSLTKDSNYDSYYSSCWSSNYKEITGYYKKVSEALDGLGNTAISEHCKIAENIYRTSYENGTQIYVNYGDSAYTDSVIEIEAKNYKVVNRG